jgi:hypothetical protein
VGPPEIPPEEIIFDPKRDFLGEGAFGKVYKGMARITQLACIDTNDHLCRQGSRQRRSSKGSSQTTAYKR